MTANTELGTLYEVDLVSGIATPDCSAPSGGLTDIAFGPDGTLYATTFTSLFSMARDTCAGTVVASTGGNSLDVAEDGVIYGGVGSTIFAFNRGDGTIITVATVPSGYTLSGDIAFLGTQLYGTVGTGSGNDFLAAFDLATTRGRIVGDTGQRCVYGLTSLEPSSLYGLTCDGFVIRIEPGTGTSSVLWRTEIPFFGAASQ